MGKDFEEELKKLILQIKGYNNDPKAIDQRVRALIIIKLEEAVLWYTKIKPNTK